MSFLASSAACNQCLVSQQDAPPTTDEGAVVTRVTYQPFPIVQDDDEDDDGGEWTYV